VRGERGSGMVSSVVGVTAFLVLLLFGSQLAMNLYASSTVTAAAFDAARIVAGANGDEAAAEAHLRELLDGYDDVRVDWTYGADDVELRIEAEHPSRLLAAVPVPFQRIVRTVTVRRETFR